MALSVLSLGLLGNGGQQLTETNNILNNLSISAITNSSTNCFASLDGSQTIQVNAGSNQFSTGGNSPCNLCIQNMKDIYNARLLLEQDLGRGQKINPVLETAMLTGSLPTSTDKKAQQLGPCSAVCKSSIIQDISQSQKLTTKQTCNVENNITNQIQNNIAGQIDSQLKNQQDVFGQFESLFTSNRQSEITKLSSNLSQNITTNFIQNLHQTLKNHQIIDISGSSVLVEGVSQGFTGSIVGSLQSTNSVVNELKNSAQYAISQSLLNKNDTLGDLAKSLERTIDNFADLLESTAGQIVIIVSAIILGIMIVALGIYLHNRANPRNQIQTNTRMDQYTTFNNTKNYNNSYRFVQPMPSSRAQGGIPPS